jgi:hypothetical protein
MEKIGVADYGIFAWDGGFYDYSERIERVSAIGFDGLERLYPTSAEDALQKASNPFQKSFFSCLTSSRVYISHHNLVQK